MSIPIINNRGVSRINLLLFFTKQSLSHLGHIAAYGKTL